MQLNLWQFTYIYAIEMRKQAHNQLNDINKYLLSNTLASRV